MMMIIIMIIMNSFILVSIKIIKNAPYNLGCLITKGKVNWSIMMIIIIITIIIIIIIITIVIIIRDGCEWQGGDAT